MAGPCRIASLTLAPAARSALIGRMARATASTPLANISTSPPPSRIVHIERMFLPDPTPDSHVETRFDPDGTSTLLTVIMTLPDAEARAAVLASGMEDGLEDSYARLDAVLRAGNV